MDPSFLQHPVQWWSGLSLSARVALFAVVFGLSTVLVATWMGVRRWWRRWKEDANDEEEERPD